MAAVPDAVVSFLLENLKDFVVTNADLIAGAKDNADKLCSDLEVLKGFLKKYTDQRYNSDDFLAGLAKKVRKLVYKAEDAIESYIEKVSKQKFRSGFKSAFHAIDHVFELRKISRDLYDLQRQVRDVYDQEVKNGLQVMQGADMMNKGKDEEGNVKKYPVDDDMVGFVDAMEEVMGYLKDGPDELQLVSIVGMLGLGKTTLAKQVFKHPTVEYQFFIRAFVEVSQEFKKKEVLLKLVRAFGNVSAQDMNHMDESDLEKAIQDYLCNRNYLIVLDDVWNQDAWNELKACFPKNQKHSRVLITTRHIYVAEHAWEGHGFSPYKLRFLHDDESKELLRKRVFGKADTIRSDLEEYETAILSRCGSLPLAIVVVAGILTNHREESYWWEDVSKKVSTFDFVKEANHAIMLSFDHLPYRLKPCFLYLGVFREDFEIPSRTLYQLWISEGFVPPGDANETSEDKAESFLEQLVGRSLVMVGKRRSNGRIKTILIHDTLREFCKKQAIEEELFREIKFGEETGTISPDDDRRLCINSNVREYITNKDRRTGKFTRSFLSFAKEDYILPLEFISEIPKAFKLLRVLDVRSIRFTRFPSELYYTFLLKYIAMRSDLEIIPEKISNLRYLQTLIFDTTKRTIEIKADIWKMKQLRHLETNASTSLQKTRDCVSVNANVQTLSAISPQSCTPDVFQRAQLLKKLGISGELAPHMETVFHSLRELEYLENLKLLNTNTTVPLKSLPHDNNFPRNLARLTLQNTMLKWDMMSTLAKLKKLKVLKLKDSAFIGGFWDMESTGGFRALEVLQIGNTDLITWKASKGHFPQLKQLYLRHCTKLADIPSDLVNISTLQRIDIHCCKPEVAKSAMKLVLARLQVKAQENNGKGTKLELLIYPPDQS